MTTLAEVESQIAAKTAAMTNVREEITKLADSISLEYIALNALYKEKYTFIDPAVFDTDQMALLELVEDAQKFRTPHDVLGKWVKSFSPRFLDANNRSSGGALPSTTIFMNQNETVDMEMVNAIQKFSKIVHGDSNYVVFDIMEHTCSEFNSYYLIVYGEDFDKAVIAESSFMLRNLTYEGHISVTEVKEESLERTLEEALSEMSKNIWYQADPTVTTEQERSYYF